MVKIDLAKVSVREANEKLRELGEKGESAEIINPDARHHLGVGLTAPINVKIKGEEYSCVDKDSGTVIDRFANEIHPINLYQDGLEATLKNVYRGYVVSLDYNCTHVINGSSFPLYGPLFYQDNQWWGFEEYDDSYWKDYEKDIEIYAFMTKFAKRISPVSASTVTATACG